MPRPAIPSKQKQLVALRQFALTSPGGRMSLIDGVRLMQQIVPADNVAIIWLDKLCNTIDFHYVVDVPLSIIQDFLENFMHSLVEDGKDLGGLSLKHVLSCGQRIVYANPVLDHNQYIRSEIYNRIGKPSLLGRSVAMPIRHAFNVPLAMLNIGRTFTAPDFNPAEIFLMEQAQPWLEHLARRESTVTAETPCIDSGESASLLIDGAGKVLSASAFAMALLHQAADTPLSVNTVRKTARGDVSELLQRIGGSVVSAMNEMFAFPPSLVINNQWGRFKLLAYALTPLESSEKMQISLYIEHHVPLSLGLFRLPRFLELTPREREVCLFSLAGLDRSEIARELGIKPSTVIYFTRQLYQRLNIYRQSELLPALMRDYRVN